MGREFTFLSLNMTRWTLIYGGFLIFWGVLFSIGAESESITSWIPAMLGAPILLMGVMCLVRPYRRKIWMHIALLFGLLGFFGGDVLLLGPSAVTCIQF